MVGGWGGGGGGAKGQKVFLVLYGKEKVEIIVSSLFEIIFKLDRFTIVVLSVTIIIPFER